MSQKYIVLNYFRWLQVFSTALLVHHGGNINGMTTEIAFIPGLNHAIVVMINEVCVGVSCVVYHE